MAKRAERIKDAEEVANEREWSLRRNLPGVEVRHMSTARSFDTVLTLGGKEVASRTEMLKRGHEVSVLYVFPQLLQFV